MVWCGFVRFVCCRVYLRTPFVLDGVSPPSSSSSLSFAPPSFLSDDRDDDELEDEMTGESAPEGAAAVEVAGVDMMEGERQGGGQGATRCNGTEEYHNETEV